MGKLPAIMFYPADWIEDNVSGCSLAAQGLWLRMMFVMHTSERRGYLVVNGRPMTEEFIASKCGCDVAAYRTLLAELLSAGVPRRTADGILYNKRMVNDERKRHLCSEAGRKGGGSPTFKGNHKGDLKGDYKGEIKGSLVNVNGNSNSVSQEPEIPKDSDTWIKKVAKAHPRFEKPVPTFQAIVEQLECLSPRMGAPQAMQYLLDRTELYRKCVDAWPRDERKFAVSSMVWFRDACFEEDEAQWRRSAEKPVENIKSAMEKA